MVLIKWGKISLAGCVVRERPSLPADVTVSELLYMLAIRAPRQGESEGGVRREGSGRGRERIGDELRVTEEERRAGRERRTEGEERGNVREGK